MIEVRELWKSYGRYVALRGISFSVPEGSIAGFLGPNGAGKTTAMRVITTFLPVDRGSVTVAGRDVSREPKAVCAEVGYLPESMPIYPDMRVAEYLRHRAVLKGIARSKVGSRVDAVIDECNLGEASGKLLAALSKGYRQRVGLADALIADPKVLVLDEPTSGLDPRQVKEVRQMIAGFRSRRTVLLSSHILGEVEQVCDQVIIIDEGQIRAQESREGWRERLRDASRLSVILEDPPDDAARILGRLDCVLDVEARDGALRLRTRGDGRAAIFEEVKRNGWTLLELRSQDATLENLFLEVTGSDGAGDGGPDEGAAA